MNEYTKTDGDWIEYSDYFNFPEWIMTKVRRRFLGYVKK